MGDFGLMFYNARMYDPALGRFTSADTIIPEQVQGVQAWDRYAYVSNNPIVYNDPSGHCPWCAGLVAGFILGFVGNITYQIGESYLSGDSFADAVHKIDWKEVALYTVASTVAGATFGALGTGAGIFSLGINTTTIEGAAVAGSLATVAGGQAQALTDSFIDTSAMVLAGEEPDASVGLTFVEDAVDAGFMDPEQIFWDAGTGAVFGAFSVGVTNFTNSTGGIQYATKTAARQNALLPGVFGASTRGIADYVAEIGQEWLDTRFKRMKELSE